MLTLGETEYGNYRNSFIPSFQLPYKSKAVRRLNNKIWKSKYTVSHKTSWWKDLSLLSKYHQVTIRVQVKEGSAFPSWAFPALRDATTRTPTAAVANNHAHFYSDHEAKL